MFAATSAELLRGEMNQLIDEAQGFSTTLDGGGELSADQQARFELLLSEDGPIEKTKAALADRERIESRMQELNETQRGNLLNQSNGGGMITENNSTKPSRIVLKGQTSRYFDDPKMAVASGAWLAGTLSQDHNDRNRLFTEAARVGGQEFAAQSIGTPGKGGVLVPTPLAAEIIKNRDEVAVAPQLSRPYTMTSETLRFNRETGDVTVVYPDESAAITPSDVDWTPHTLTAKQRGVLVRMSRQFVADSNVAALDEVLDNMSHRFAYALDNEWINGDGTSTYGGETGLIGAAVSGNTLAADTGVDTIAELTLADFTALKAKLPHKHRRNASWVFAPAAWSHVEGLLLESGGAATQEFSAGFTGSPRFLNSPVFESDLMPTPAASTFVAFYGDFRNAVALGDRGDMALETSTERYFETGDVAVRGLHRYDILVFNAAAYVGLELAA